MSTQTTNHLLMIRPVSFTYNAQTAVNNAFQQINASNNAQENALIEFDNFVKCLRDNNVDVTVVNDTPQPHTPDSIFPNNWISFHEEGYTIQYPMYAANRRAERKQTVIDAIKEKFHISFNVDLSFFEKENKFLEGTGSMVLDRENEIAYACLSARTDETVLQKFCEATSYKPCVFYAVDEQGNAIYHTNVVMCVTNEQVIICLGTITDAQQKQKVIDTITQSGKEIIDITLQQMNKFAGNMLQVVDADGNPILVMSSTAHNALTENQLLTLSNHNKIVHSSLSTIETNGGGSARCMMAEIFLQKKGL